MLEFGLQEGSHFSFFLMGLDESLCKGLWCQVVIPRGPQGGSVGYSGVQWGTVGGYSGAQWGSLGISSPF